MAEKQIHSLSVDFSKVEPIKTDIKLKQFEFGSDVFHVSVYDEGKLYDPTGGNVLVCIRIQRPDGKMDEKIIYDTRLSDNQITDSYINSTDGDNLTASYFIINPYPFFTFCSGDIKCELWLRVYDDEGNTTINRVSQPFIYQIYKSISSYNMIDKKSIDIITALIDAVTGLQATVTYDEYVDKLNGAVKDIKAILDAKVNVIDEYSDNSTYPSSKAVFDIVTYLKKLLVGEVPENLNSLEKLADAVGNNPNFSQYVLGDINSIRSSASGAEDTINSHLSDFNNPHNIQPGDIGLGHVDNTSDEDKPLSSDAREALGMKLDKSAVYDPEPIEGDPFKIPSVAYMLDYVSEKCKDNIVDLGTYKVEVDPDTGNMIIDESSQFRNAVNEAKQTGIYKITHTEAGAQMPFILVVLSSVDLRGKDLVTQYCFRDNPFLPADYNVPSLPHIRKYYYSDEKNAYVWTDDGYFTSESIFQTTTNLVHDDTNFNENSELKYPSVGSMVRYIDRKLQPEQPITILPDILESNKEYIIGGFLDSVFISFPSIANRGDVIYITFYAENVDGLPNLVIDTTNTSDIELIPEPSAGYEIFAKYNGEIWIVDYSEYSLGW